MFITELFNNPLAFIIYAALIVMTIGLHEFAHAKVADLLGDPTPKLQGRLTLNPLAHIDPLGLILLFVAGFGWGKPVQFDPFNLKNPRKEAALISLAGPSTNFIIAIICSILLHLFIFFNQQFLVTIGTLFFVPFISLNVLLGIFNLIPIAPLDGFKVVGGILNREQAIEWYRLERFGIIFLLILIVPITGKSMLSTYFLPVVDFFTRLLIP